MLLEVFGIIEKLDEILTFLVMKYFLISLFLLIGLYAQSQDSFQWPKGQKIAVSLSYDDALNSQLDYAIPSLNKYSLRGSFYLLPNSLVVRDRMAEWRAAAEKGHELANHSIYHPCRASLPNRDWVPPHHDMDKYSLVQIREELMTASTVLYAIDGKTERTFTPPCGDFKIEGENYISTITDLFVAIKGQGTVDGFATLWGPTEVTGQQLIDFVKNTPADAKMVNIIFHGVGGDYLSVSNEAHEELLKFLSENQDKYWVDSYINIMKYVNEKRK